MPLTKPVPLTASVKPALPAATLAGLTLVMLGVGLLLGVGLGLGEGMGLGALLAATTVKFWTTEVPPPGAGVKTEIFSDPPAATSLAGMAAFSWLAEITLVVRSDPLRRTTELLEKLAPVASRVRAGPPAVAVVGLMLVRDGTWFGAITANGRKPEVPPPGAGVATVT